MRLALALSIWLALPACGQELGRLLSELGAPRCATRDRATRALIARGGEVIGALRAHDASDPEVRWRVELILRAVGGLPPRRQAQVLKRLVVAGVQVVLLREGDGPRLLEVDGQRYQIDNMRDRRRLARSHRRLYIELFRRGGHDLDAQRGADDWPLLGVRLAREPAGLRLTALMPGARADRYGLRPRDLLRSLAGRPLLSEADLAQALEMIGPEQGFVIELERAGERLLLAVRRTR